MPMKQFQVQHRSSNEIDILELSGELDAHTAPVLEDAIKELIHKEKLFIIVNFNGLEYIASAGLGVFMAYIEEVRAKGGDIKLTNMNHRVFNVFDLLGFPALYDIYADEAEATNQYLNRP
ncbi:MAG: STAS domain-containing protein [Balneolaceae bacterium]